MVLELHFDLPRDFPAIIDYVFNCCLLIIATIGGFCKLQKRVFKEGFFLKT